MIYMSHFRRNTMKKVQRDEVNAIIKQNQSLFTCNPDDFVPVNVDTLDPEQIRMFDNMMDLFFEQYEMCKH